MKKKFLLLALISGIGISTFYGFKSFKKNNKVHNEEDKFAKSVLDSFDFSTNVEDKVRIYKSLFKDPALFNDIINRTKANLQYKLLGIFNSKYATLFNETEEPQTALAESELELKVLSYIKDLEDLNKIDSVFSSLLDKFQRLYSNITDVYYKTELEKEAAVNKELNLFTNNNQFPVNETNKN